MKKQLYTAFITLLFMLANNVFSGEIHLKNGDILNGELVEINSEQIVWRSAVLGDLFIPKSAIQSIQTEIQLKLAGQPDACVFSRLSGGNVEFSCSGESKSIPLLTLQGVVEYENHQETTEFYAGKITVVGSQTSGNSEKQDWLVDLDLTHRYTDFRHEYGLKYVGESRDSGSAEEEYEGIYVFDWFFSPQTYWYLDVSANSNEAKQLQEKYTVGTGLGYQFWESQKTAFSIKTGGVYTNESYEYEDKEVETDPMLDESTQDFVSWSLASNFRYLFFEKFAFYNRADFLWSFDEPEEGEPKGWSAQTDTGVSMPIAKGLSADIALEYDYDNSPQDANREEDARLRFGVGYAW